MLKKISLVCLYFAAVLILALPHSSSASTAAISAFSVNPSSISYGMTAGLSWTLNNSSGASLTITCPDGLTVKYDNTGASFPCNAKTFVSSNQSESLPLDFTNISGNTKAVSIRLTPRDLSGNDDDAASQTITVTVGTSPQPITDFSAPNSIRSGGTAGLSWTSHDISGVNFIFSCNNDISISNPADNSKISCGTLALSSPTNANPFNFIFNNSSGASTTLTVSIIPGVTAATYDATHGATAIIEVGPKPLPPAPKIKSLSADTTEAVYDHVFNLKWTAENISGVNFMVSCGSSGINVFTSTSTAAKAASCGSLLFPDSLPASGETSLYIKNTSGLSQTLNVALVAEITDGSYNTAINSQLSLTLRPSGWVKSASSAVSASKPVTSSNNSGSNGSATTAIAQGQAPTLKQGLALTRGLDIGSRGSDVKALQEFFLSDPVNYPGALVTGYFGPLTRKFVMTFQTLHNLAGPGDAGYGYVGPKTRAKLNSL